MITIGITTKMDGTIAPIAMSIATEDGKDWPRLRTADCLFFFEVTRPYV
jgi:hypothetical protein